MAERGFPLTRTMVMAFALTIAKRSGCVYHFNEELGPNDIGGNYSRGVVQSLRCVKPIVLNGHELNTYRRM